MATALSQTACVLLAAGLSSRYPGDKLLADLNGRPLLDHAASMLAALPFKARIAVVPPDAPARWEHLAALDFAITVNMQSEAGQGASLRAGAAAAAAHMPAAVLLMLADMPFVPESHVRALLARLDPADPKSIAFSLGGGAEGGWRGPPAAFGAGWLADLAHTEGDQGARPILRNVPESRGVRAPSAWLADFDTPADFASAGHTETLP